MSSGPDCILVVVLKICELKLFDMLAEFFNICVKESCFPDCWSISFVVPVFWNVGENLQLKTIVFLVFSLWLKKSLKDV